MIFNADKPDAQTTVWTTVGELQVAVIVFWGANSVQPLKAYRLPLAAAISICLGLLKEAGDHLQVPCPTLHTPTRGLDCVCHISHTQEAAM